MYMSILGGSVDFFLPTPIPTSCTSQFLTPPPLGIFESPPSHSLKFDPTAMYGTGLTKNGSQLFNRNES
jgi:hypothetical protein